MRAILIEEERFTEVADLMKLSVADMHENGYIRKELSESQAKFAVDEISRRIHMTFVRWAQSHGASCTKR